MAELSKITLPSGTTYDIKDAVARELLESLEGFTHYLGITTTPLEDESTVNPIKIDGVDVTAVAGNIALYQSHEFIFNGTHWQQFGHDLDTFGALAYKNSAEGTYIPTGTVSQPTFTGTQSSVEVTSSVSGNVEISTGSGTANFTPAGTVSQPTFTGTQGTVNTTGSVTGNVSITTGSGATNFTPAGTVSAPTINASTDTVNIPNITAVGTLPELTMTVQNETLSFAWNAGTLPTKGSDLVAVSSVSATATAPTFTGTGVQLVADASSLSVSSSGYFTPAGTVSQPSFSGTGVELVADASQLSVSGTAQITPEGTISQPTFTGTQSTITVS